MSDPTRKAFWKWMPLGDHLENHETIVPKYSQARVVDVPWSKTASIQQTQASSSTEYVLSVGIYREGEDSRAFMKRVLEFNSNLLNATVSTQDSVGQLGGELCIVECGDHITTLDADIIIGGPTVNLAEDVGFQQGEYILLSNGTDTWEVIQVTAVNGIEIAIAPTVAWSSATIAARLLYHVPRAHLVADITLNGDDDRAHSARIGTEVRFVSVDGALA